MYVLSLPMQLRQQSYKSHVINYALENSRDAKQQQPATEVPQKRERFASTCCYIQQHKTDQNVPQKVAYKCCTSLPKFTELMKTFQVKNCCLFFLVSHLISIQTFSSKSKYFPALHKMAKVFFLIPFFHVHTSQSFFRAPALTASLVFT